MNIITVKGIVFSGERAGGHFVRIPWARKQIKEKLGFDPHLGTLNIHFPEKEAKLLEKTLKDFKGIEITPARSFFRAHCFKVLIMNKVKGAVVIPEKTDYPSNVLEILAPVYLRKTLSLKDSDEVEITIFLDPKIKA